MAALAALGAALAARGAEPAYKPGGVYPSRPVRLIVPYAAGAPADAIARLVAPVLSESLGAPVIVDNRAGENAVSGTALAATSGNQGYTLLMADTAFAIAATRSRRLPYDPVKDLIPITLVASAPLAEDVQGTASGALAAYARANGAAAWYGLFAPAGTQWNIVTHLAGHTAKALERADVKSELVALGVESVGSDPELFERFVANEIAKWRKASQAVGLKPQ